MYPFFLSVNEQFQVFPSIANIDHQGEYTGSSPWAMCLSRKPLAGAAGALPSPMPWNSVVKNERSQAKGRAADRDADSRMGSPSRGLQCGSGELKHPVTRFALNGRCCALLEFDGLRRECKIDSGLIIAFDQFGIKPGAML